MISVIVPSYNGAQLIMKLVKSLELQTHTDFEVVFVIDGSEDNSAELLENGNLPYPNRIIVQSNQGRARARNAGASDARGDLLVFLDDDLEAHPDLLELHQLHQNRYPGTILVGNLFHQADTPMTDFDRFRIYLNQRWLGNLPANPDQPMSQDSVYLSAANFSISKRDFDQLHGFDPNLNDCEDYELAVRATLKGIPIHFDRRASCLHLEDSNCRKYALRLREYKQANDQLIATSEVPEFFLNRYRKLQDLGAHKRLVYGFFSRKHWVDLVDNANYYFRILPRYIRYRLYDVILTGLSVYYPERKI